MSRTRRLLYFGIILICQAIYLPLNRFLRGGVVLMLPVDGYTPIYPIWAIPYVLWMVCWFFLWFWAAMYMPETLYRQLVTSALVVIFSAMVVFIVVPTYVPRRPVDMTAPGAFFLQMIYAVDNQYCAFPSGHIYLCTLSALYFSRWHPRTSGVWILIIAIVTLSTLFTGQHYLLDIIGGWLFVFGGDALGRKILVRKTAC